MQNTLCLCGEKGVRWLNDLPEIIEEIEENWQNDLTFPEIWEE
jgi:hypothetical protein